MGPGEYLLASLAIITGLAVSDMVTSLHGLLLNRRYVKWDWLALVAASLVFVVIVNSWGISYRIFSAATFGPPFWYFLLTLGSLIPFYLAARAILPDHVPLGDEVDLAGHYAFVSRYFWAAISMAAFLYLLLMAYDGGLGLVLERERPTVLYLLLMAPLIVWNNRLLHAFLVPVLTVLFLAFTLPAAMPA